MMGYQKGVKGYMLRCLEPGNQKILVRRDVVLIEDKMPFQEKRRKSVQKSDLKSNDAGVWFYWWFRDTEEQSEIIDLTTDAENSDQTQQNKQ